MQGREASPLELVSGAIRTYLREHPEAADGAEGIQRWWLPGGELDAPLERVVQALEQLFQEGYVTKRRLPDGREIYAASGSRDGPRGSAVPPMGV